MECNVLEFSFPFISREGMIMSHGPLTSHPNMRARATPRTMALIGRDDHHHHRGGGAGGHHHAVHTRPQ